jgi:DNA-binding NarL/FixJ family response regulator
MEQKIATNELGQRVGQDHHLAKNTDREVEIARVLHEGGMGYARIAKLMEVRKSTVQGWINGRRRNHEIVKWKVVK